MALDNFRTQKIIWDRANKKIFETIEANSGDSNGRKLVVQVINQKATEVLTGTTLSLGWKHRNGAKGLDAFNVVDASKGIFEIYYTTEMLSNIGNIEASLILIDSTGRIESSTFTISVRPSTVDDESVESENSFTALTEALVKVNDLEDNYVSRFNEFTVQLQQTEQELSSQLAQTKNSLMFSGDFGESIDIPLDFPLEKIPFNLFVDTNGAINHDYEITSEFFGTNIYLKQNGVDSNDGLSELTPVKTLKRAIELANVVSTSRAIINIVAHPTYKSVLFNANYGLTANIPILRDIVIKPLNHETEKVYITSADIKAFTAYNSIYKTTGTSTATLDVFDTLNLEVDGSPKVYKKKNSISEVEAEKGSWFMDSSGYIYVNTIDGRPADYDIVINRDFGSFALVFGGKKIVMYNTTIARSGNVNAKDSLFLSGDSNSIFINQQCHFMFGFNNGLSVRNADSFSFDSTSHETGMDGFNYHSEMIENPYMLAFEYQCKGSNFGTRKTGTNNASTAHEGIYTLRIDCEYHTAHGPVIADVNGCFSVIYNSKAYDSIRTAGETKAAFYFDNALQVANHGKAYLIECEGGGEGTFSVNSDKTIPIYLRKMKGRNVPNGNLINPY